MTDKMLKFVKVDQQTPNKRKVSKRVDDFNEILAIKNYRSGDKLKLKIWRRGRYLDRTLILG